MTEASQAGNFLGLKFELLPAGWTPLAAAILVKCLDENGTASWAFRTTDDMNDEELLGALTVRTDLLRRGLVESYAETDGQED
jgi:hypothetical protein